jgi:hypothetical protein
MTITPRRLLSFLSGNLARRVVLFALLPLIWFSYFGTLTIAAWFSPETYDWRRKAISKLLYPRDDPEFHSIASLGIALTGLMMIPFAGYIRRRLRSVSATTTDIGISAFGLGAICLILAGLIVSHPYQETSTYPRLHEMLARGSALALGVSMLVLWASALKGYLASSGKTSRWRWLLISWSLVTLPAIFVIVLRLVAHLRLEWSNPIYRLLQNPRVWHLGFWEWIGSAAVFLFLLCSALFLPEHVPSCSQSAPSRR